MTYVFVEESTKSKHEYLENNVFSFEVRVIEKFNSASKLVGHRRNAYTTLSHASKLKRASWY